MVPYEPPSASSLVPSAPSQVNVIRELMHRHQARLNAPLVVGKEPKPPHKLKRSATYKMNSRGTGAQRGAWSTRLHLLKARKAAWQNEVNVLRFLQMLEKHNRPSNLAKIKLFRRGKVFNKKGMVNASLMRFHNHSNRFSSSFSMSDFLRAAFGEAEQRLKSLRGKRLRSRTAAAVALQISPGTITCMRYVVAGHASRGRFTCWLVFMLLAKLPHLTSLETRLMSKSVLELLFLPR